MVVIFYLGNRPFTYNYLAEMMTPGYRLLIEIKRRFHNEGGATLDLSLAAFLFIPMLNGFLVSEGISQVRGSLSILPTQSPPLSASFHPDNICLIIPRVL